MTEKHNDNVAVTSEKNIRFLLVETLKVKCAKDSGAIIGILRIMGSAHLLDVFDAFDDVVPLDGFFDGVCVAEDGQVLFQGLLH